jgi:hypothetical protein
MMVLLLFTFKNFFSKIDKKDNDSHYSVSASRHGKENQMNTPVFWVHH